MRMMKSKTKPWALSAGLLGCFCFGGGDWLMMYGNPTFEGKLKWLTIGTAAIPQWRQGAENEELSNKSTFKGIKSELTVKYGVSKSDEIWKYANSEYAGVCACL